MKTTSLPGMNPSHHAETSDSGGTTTGTIILSQDDDLNEPLPVPQTCNLGEECESCS